MIGPPEATVRSGSSRVRSGLIRLPASAFVGRAEHHVAGGQEHPRVVAGGEHREGPVEAGRPLGRRARSVHPRHGRDQPHLAAAVVVAHQAARPAGTATGRPGVDDVGVVALDGDVAALGAAGGVAVGPADGAVGAVGWHADGAGVLLGGVHPVRESVIHLHPVELRGRLVVDAAPGLAPVQADGGAAVVALDHPHRVRGVDPQVVVVVMRGGDHLEGVAAVGGAVHLLAERPDLIGIGGVGVHVGEVERLLPQLGVVGDHLPRIAVVVGAVQPAVARFDQRPDAARACRRYGDADPAQDAARQPRPAGQLLPRCAAVGGAEDAGVRAAGSDGPGLADHLPERREQHVRPVRVQGQVTGAGRFAAIQHPLPGGAAVGGAEHAALRVAAEGAA